MSHKGQEGYNTVNNSENRSIRFPFSWKKSATTQIWIFFHCCQGPLQSNNKTQNFTLHLQQTTQNPKLSLTSSKQNMFFSEILREPRWTTDASVCRLSKKNKVLEGASIGNIFSDRRVLRYLQANLWHSSSFVTSSLASDFGFLFQGVLGSRGTMAVRFPLNCSCEISNLFYTIVL